MAFSESPQNSFRVYRIDFGGWEDHQREMSDILVGLKSPLLVRRFFKVGGFLRLGVSPSKALRGSPGEFLGRYPRESESIPKGTSGESMEIKQKTRLT